MGSCCSKDMDSRTSWSPEENKNGSTASTVVAQPIGDDTAGVFVSKTGGAITTITTTETLTMRTATNENSI